MGFLKDLSNDISQAVDELMQGEIISDGEKNKKENKDNNGSIDNAKNEEDIVVNTLDDNIDSELVNNYTSLIDNIAMDREYDANDLFACNSSLDKTDMSDEMMVNTLDEVEDNYEVNTLEEEDSVSEENETKENTENDIEFREDDIVFDKDEKTGGNKEEGNDYSDELVKEIMEYLEESQEPDAANEPQGESDNEKDADIESIFDKLAEGEDEEVEAERVEAERVEAEEEDVDKDMDEDKDEDIEQVNEELDDVANKMGQNEPDIEQENDIEQEIFEEQEDENETVRTDIYSESIIEDESEDEEMAKSNDKEIDEIINTLEEIEKGGVDDGAFDKTLSGKGTMFSNREDDTPATDEVTVISKGTTVGGGINASGSLEIYGNVNGDVECKSKLTILGNVSGSATAAEIYINTSRFEGDVNSKGPVKIGLGTVVIGDVTGSSAVIAGAVKGEIDITGPVILDSTAVVKGNVKGKSVQVNNGAVLQGFCSLAYAEVDIDEFFEAEEYRP